jgi:hypothetical protein
MKRIFNTRYLRNIALMGGATYGGLYAIGEHENANCLAGGLSRAGRAIAYGTYITMNYFRVNIVVNIVRYQRRDSPICS